MLTVDNAPSVVSLMRQHARLHAGREAVLHVQPSVRGEPAESLTYAMLDREARRLASRLWDVLPAGATVLLLHPTGLAFVTAFFACLYAGMVAVPAPLPGQYQHQRHRVLRIAADAGVGGILTDAASLDDVAAWAHASSLDRLPRIATDPADPAGEPEAWTPPDGDRGTLAMLQYTSGSTGDPKGVMVTHGNLLANLASLQAALGFTERTRFGGWIPLYHDMGLMGQLLPALLRGSTAALMRPMTFLRRPYLWLKMIDEHDIGFSAAPNFAYDLCCRRVSDEQLATLDLSRWEFAANGSEPVLAATLAAFAKRFAPAGFRPAQHAPCYGMAEATVFISGAGRRPPVVRRADADLLAAHRLGPPAPGAPSRELVSCALPRDLDLRIVDPGTGRTLPDGRVGEIWLRGDSVAAGYWRSDEATAATFAATTAAGESGFLRTGDLGVRDAGELYVTGRIKDLLIVHGRNLYPQDIEQEIRAQHPEVAGSSGAVFAVSTPEEALVVAQEVPGRIDQQRLREIAAGIRLTVAREFGAPVAGVVLLRPGGVRHTTSGKVQRTAMRDLFLAGELAPLLEDVDPRLGPARANGWLAGG
jgi:acyl-CoA synthetase (AMP-forming)/AMP-acid ligase II